MRPAARRYRRAQAEPFAEILDVGHVVVVAARSEHHEAPLRDVPEHLEEAAIALAVDAGRTRDDELHAGARRGVAADALAFELRLLVDVAGPERRVFVRGRMFDVAVHADGAALHHAPSPGVARKLDERGRRPSR